MIEISIAPASPPPRRCFHTGIDGSLAGMLKKCEPKQTKLKLSVRKPTNLRRTLETNVRERLI